MGRKDDVVALVLSLFVAFLLINLFSFYYFDLTFLPVIITGNAVDAGLVDLYVEGAPKVITIHYPTNTTYNFNIGDPYLFQYNVTANYFVDDWSYSLYDERHDVAIETNTDFTPNTSSVIPTFTAVRWDNNLTINAHETDGIWRAQSVFFYVSVPNSAPILGPIDDQIYFCENSNAIYLFNATDADEDVPTVSMDPFGPFIFPFYLTAHNTTLSLYRLFSASLDSPSTIGFFSANISIDDGEYADSTITNITVIELNDVPVAPSIGTQTVYKTGENSTFNYEWAVTDEEDGVAYDENMTFNISWPNDEDLFDINSTTGVINFTADVTYSSITYSAVTVCVTDNALTTPHPNISSECSSTGSANTVCDSFNFVITGDNRPPEIINFSPATTNFSVEGTTTTNFFVNVSDPDMVNAYPDIDWYVDDVLTRQIENESTDTFSYSFGCGVSGLKNVTAVTTDGLENDTQDWEVTVLLVACPIPSSGGGGGGGSLSKYCNEQWVCNDFEVCQNTERSYGAGALSPEDYSDAREICAQKGFDKRICGFQITTCFDLIDCNNTILKIPKPTETRICHFTENPSCFDKITNCHDGSCELLVDCGGPCGACATCTDGIQNQGEGNIDCGGPCPFICERENPYGFTSYAIILLFILLLLLLLFILYKFFKIIRYKISGKKGK